ncbi:lytic polysaccharide monooxygenase, partial [Dissoconium aciculare CBS 342.82]|uniref:lytic cellulose monooxygenase (C4-dehydrogenating) n=1 Tax=Dissoconium aciculare CBS 342.82 TaxID=1314786 RepID=A0A6J3M9J6_9PEZI
MRSRPSLALALVSAILKATVNAHGWLSQITIEGQTFPGCEPSWSIADNGEELLDRTASWCAYNQHNDFLDSSAAQNRAMICHNGASPGAKILDIKAGAEITFGWLDRFFHHPGPIVTYMARCPGSCADVSAHELKFFKIQEHALIPRNAVTIPLGPWATEKLTEQSGRWALTIPSNIAPGEYVIRHEVIALHHAFVEGDAQHYPMCVNLRVSSTESVDPCAKGADCRRGTELYRSNDPGIYLDIFDPQITDYVIPGPPIWPG